MKKAILILIILLIVLFLFGCIEQGKNNPTLWVYKTSEDYHTKVSIMLNQNNTVVRYPVLPSSYEVKVSNGYFYAPGSRLNSLNGLVVTDIELSELQTWKQDHSSSELIDHIIEMHPFEEAYLCDLNIGLTPDWENEVPQITQSLSVGEIPKECEKVNFTLRADELK